MKKKMPILIETDATTNRLDRPSLALESFGGVPAIRFIARRVSAIENVSCVYVAAPEDQTGLFRAALDGLENVRFFPHALPDLPARKRLRAARRYFPDGWRGSPLGTTYYDERGNPFVMQKILAAEESAALCAVGDSALLCDVELLRRQIGNFLSGDLSGAYSFAAAPPGIAGEIYSRGMVADMAAGGLAPRDWLALPADKRRALDPVKTAMAFNVPERLRQLRARFTADTPEGFRLLEKLLPFSNDGAFPDLDQDKLEQVAGASGMPRALEVELTTTTPCVFALRPHGTVSRADMEPELFEKIARAAAASDEPVLVTLGGFGDPLVYPSIETVLGRLHELGIRDVHLTTTMLDPDWEALERLKAFDSAVVSCFLDAAREETYGKLVSGGDFGRLSANVERLIETMRGSNVFVACEYVRVDENEEELYDAFYRWYPQTGCFTIQGHNDRAGQLEHRNPIDLLPAMRFGCRKIAGEMLVLSDGRVPLCRQDFRGTHTLGNVKNETVESVWNGPAADKLRRLHRERDWDANPLCRNCLEWAALSG